MFSTQPDSAFSAHAATIFPSILFIGQSSSPYLNQPILVDPRPPPTPLHCSHPPPPQPKQTQTPTQTRDHGDPAPSGSVEPTEKPRGLARKATPRFKTHAQQRNQRARFSHPLLSLVEPPPFPLHQTVVEIRSTTMYCCGTRVRNTGAIAPRFVSDI